MMKKIKNFRLCPEAVEALVAESERTGKSETAVVEDILRHTYASMRMAAGASAHSLADEMGNSPRILLTHYRELVRREDAERFWSLRPEPVPTPASS